jgi:hypothetical protein
MSFVSITKTFKSRHCKPPVTPPGGGGPPVPTHPIYIPIVPEHPIVIPPEQPEPPQPPLGIWGPTDPRPTNPIYLPIGGTPDTPNVPTHPIYIPVYPSHPIVLPPEENGDLKPTIRSTFRPKRSCRRLRQQST